MHRTTAQSGVTVVLVLVFMGIFLMMLAGLSGYVLTQAKIQRVSYAREQAFQVAESGLEYYRWFLAHNPGNLTDGTGASGPYVHDATDASGNTIGTYSLTIAGHSSCGELQSIDITSKGTASDAPQYTRTLEARYAKPSVADYAYIINDSVWAGADRQITGPYHSNGGVRMDGTSNSIVSSSVNTWQCTSAFGCSPSSQEPGVFGAGSDAALWQYPVPQIDFTGIASDFPTLKSVAQSQGLYFPSLGGSSQRGYHLIFNADGTVDVYEVTRTTGKSASNVNGDSKHDYDIIKKETWLGTYTIPSGCPVIYTEATSWIEGTISGKVTLVAADTTHGYTPDILLNNNIDYTVDDGTVGLTAIAEGNVRIPYQVPNDLSVSGIFVAQTGYFGRDYYGTSDKKGTLTINGSVVSNQRVGTKWTVTYCYWYGCSTDWSGFNNRVNTYDRALADSPPAFTPAASQDSTFTIWKEQQ